MRGPLSCMGRVAEAVAEAIAADPDKGALAACGPYLAASVRVFELGHANLYRMTFQRANVP